MESNHVPLDTLSVEFAVLPPHSQVLLFPNPLVVLKLAVHLPLNVLPLLRARAGLQCPASLSQSHFLLLSVDECPHQCLSQRHNATDWQSHSVNTSMNTVYNRTCDYHAKEEGILTFWSNCLIVSYTVLLIVVGVYYHVLPPVFILILYLGLSILHWQSLFKSRPGPTLVLLSTASKVAGISGKATLKSLPPAWNTVWAKHSLQRS